MKRLLLGTILAVLLAPAGASAGSYTVTACHDPATGRPLGDARLPSGWRLSGAAASWFEAYADCGNTGSDPSHGFGIRVPAAGGVIPGSPTAPKEARLLFEAPPDTTLTGYTLWRALSRTAQGSSPLLARVVDPAGIAESCSIKWSSCTLGTWALSGMFSSANALTRTPGSGPFHVALVCDGSCSQSRQVDYRIFAARVTLADSRAPTITSVPAVPRFMRGPAALALTAADRGGGLASAEATLGAARATRELCPPGVHAATVPCPLTATETLSLDTAAIPDGPAELALRLIDVAGNATARPLGTAIVDNHPPVLRARGQGSPDAWQPGPVTVTLSAHDALSGMGGAADGAPLDAGGYVEYSLDGAQPRQVRGDVADVEVAADGTHTIAFSAHDVAGNASGESVVTVRLDSPSSSLRDLGRAFGARAFNSGASFSAARSFAESCPDAVTLAPARAAYLGEDGALLGFDLPAAPRCHVASARLRVQSAETLSVQRLASSWDEDVTAATLPGGGGPIAGGSAGEVDVTRQVDDVYRYGDDGLLLRGAAEAEARAAELVVSYE